jgi:hypothetical protein
MTDQQWISSRSWLSSVMAAAERQAGAMNSRARKGRCVWIWPNADVETRLNIRPLSDTSSGLKLDDGIFR